MAKNIYFHTGGPFHPTAAQAKVISETLGPDFQVIPRHGTEIFEDLDQCDLFVASALHWTGMDWVNNEKAWPAEHPTVTYQAPSDDQKQAFRDYVASGRPVLGFHGGVACYDDWLEYGQLLGVRWLWSITNHGKCQDWTVTPQETGHPVIEGVNEFQLHDEIYVNLQITPGLPFTLHAVAVVTDMKFPMILTAEGPEGRIPGAGKTAYLANGHDLKTLESPELQQIIRNTVNWLTN